MRIGINGSGTLSSNNLQTVVDDIAATEADGFSSHWLAHGAGIDALTALALAGPSDTGVQLGTAVIPTWPVHPQVLAHQAITTQAAVGGRLTLGIGLSHEPAVTGQLKMKWERPVRHMMDYLDILLPLINGESVNHDGYFWSFHGGMGRCTDTPPKVMIAALGEQMLKLTGKRADGTILWCVGPKTIKEHIAPVINDAAEKAGRDQPAIVCSLPVWVTDKPDEARDFIAKMLAIYAELPSYRHMLDIEGVPGLGELSIVGSEDEVASRIADIAASGATDFTAVPMGFEPDEQSRTRAAIKAAIDA